MDHSLTPYFMKKVTQMILSFSLFSFIFSYSSWFSIFKFYFTSLPFKLLTHTLDKNCTFLICNALLVFLANASGLLYSQSRFDPNERDDENNGWQRQTQIKEALLDNEVYLGKEKEKEGSNSIVKDGEQNESSGFVNREEDKESLSFMIEDEEQEEISRIVNNEDSTTCLLENKELEIGSGFEEKEEIEMERLRTEELNKKCEEFIRKMKRAIRFEARGQLIMAI